MSARRGLLFGSPRRARRPCLARTRDRGDDLQRQRGRRSDGDAHPPGQVLWDLLGPELHRVPSKPTEWRRSLRCSASATSPSRSVWCCGPSSSPASCSAPRAAWAAIAKRPRTVPLDDRGRGALGPPCLLQPPCCGHDPAANVRYVLFALLEARWLRLTRLETFGSSIGASESSPSSAWEPTMSSSRFANSPTPLRRRSWSAACACKAFANLRTMPLSLSSATSIDPLAIGRSFAKSSARRPAVSGRRSAGVGRLPEAGDRQRSRRPSLVESPFLPIFRTPRAKALSASGYLEMSAAFD
jgi:hypothetical protein